MMAIQFYTANNALGKQAILQFRGEVTQGSSRDSAGQDCRLGRAERKFDAVSSRVGVKRRLGGGLATPSRTPHKIAGASLAPRVAAPGPNKTDRERERETGNTRRRFYWWRRTPTLHPRPSPPHFSFGSLFLFVPSEILAMDPAVDNSLSALTRYSRGLSSPQASSSV